MRQQSNKPGSRKRQSPWRNRILNLLIILCLCVVAVSGYQLFKIWQRYHVGTKTYQEVQKVAGTDEKKQTEPDWPALTKKYEDIRAWLYQKGTVINYPVAQADDNSYYLYRLINGKWNVKGTLFIDYRNEHPFKDFMTVIYGHRMKDHSMFWHIADYRELKYYRKHPTMTLYTPHNTYTMKIFAATTIPADSERYQFSFPTKADRQEYLNWIAAKSDIQTNVNVSADDRIVMLSTCTYEYQDARAVVFAKLVKK